MGQEFIFQTNCSTSVARSMYLICFPFTRLIRHYFPWPSKLWEVHRRPAECWTTVPNPILSVGNAYWHFCNLWVFIKCPYFYFGQVYLVLPVSFTAKRFKHDMSIQDRLFGLDPVFVFLFIQKYDFEIYITTLKCCTEDVWLMNQSQSGELMLKSKPRRLLFVIKLSLVNHCQTAA